MLPDSELSTTVDREAARADEARRRRPDAELLVITPAASAGLPRRPLHQIARALAVERLGTGRGQDLRRELAGVLGDIEPNATPRLETTWKRDLPGAVVEAVALRVEDGITVPLLLLRPAGQPRPPLVVGIDQAGKERFLAGRAEAVAQLLSAGIAVCLPDVRAIGETSADPDHGDDGAQRRLADREFALGNTILGARLKDLRTVLAYLARRPDLDPARIALWGDSFAPPNPRDLFLDELQLESGPQTQRHAAPLGAHLALLAALYEPSVRAVVAQRGLASYLSVLDDAFTYTPLDITVPGILAVADIPDVTRAIAPRPLLLAGSVNGRNVEVTRAIRPRRRRLAARSAPVAGGSV